MISTLTKLIVLAFLATLSSVVAVDGTRKNSVRREGERKEFGRAVDEAAVELLLIRR